MDCIFSYLHFDIKWKQLHYIKKVYFFIYNNYISVQMFNRRQIEDPVLNQVSSFH